MVCPGAFHPAAALAGNIACASQLAPPLASVTAAGGFSAAAAAAYPLRPWRAAAARRPSPRGPAVLAVSAPQRQQGPLASAAPSSSQQGAAGARGPGAAEVPVRIVGVGTRGASALAKLVEHGKVANAELWCLDVDKNVTDRVPQATAILVPKEGTAPGGGQQGPLSQADLLRIVGRGASDAGGRGNINSGDGGLAFVVAPAAAVPGGPQVVMQLAAALRAAGHFTVVALTQPFGFEGAAKAEAAASLAAALRSSAHLVAEMEQEVLMQAFGDSQLTVAEATDIADNALEHTVRAVLQAVQAQEVLKSSRGALMWHGRELRHFKRLISPPLQQLLTSTNTAVLGRGLAAIPADVAQQMGAGKALMHLASDAVRAAAESPFLDGALEGASGVLCSLTLPALGLEMQGMQQQPQQQQQATRMAVQAAAGALTAITGGQRGDFIMSAEQRLPEAAAAAIGSSKVEVEATLLVLRSPGATAAAGRPAASATNAPAAGHSMGAAALKLQGQPGAGPQRLPPTAWNALSAMAGGTAKAAGKEPPGVAALPAQQQQQGENEKGGEASPKGGTPFNFFQGGVPPQQRTPASHLARPAGAVPPRPKSGPPPAPAPAGKDARPASPAASSAAASSGSSAVPPTSSARSAPAPKEGQQAQQAGQQQGQPKVTVGDYLVDSLTAQSLDLPPAAARWRQQLRADSPANRPKLIVWEVDQLEPWEEEEEEEKEGGLTGLLMGRRKGERKVNLRERVSGVLQQDREEAWQQEDVQQQRPPPPPQQQQ